MLKLLFLSVVAAMIALPITFARMKNPARGLKRAVLAVVAFNVCYTVGMLLFYLQLYLREDGQRFLGLR
jgi:hypothetical protein